MSILKKLPLHISEIEDYSISLFLSSNYVKFLYSVDNGEYGLDGIGVSDYGKILMEKSKDKSIFSNIINFSRAFHCYYKFKI